jgi:antitoxin VapB
MVEFYIVALSIKNAETDKLVQALAALTGESLTEAITVAVRERLARLEAERGPARVERLLSIGRDAAARLKEPFRSADHGALLYDERGLPK